MKKLGREPIEYCKLTPVLLLLILAAVVSYVYFLNISVVQVVLQKQTIRETQDLRNQIALLEAEYIEAQHTIAARMANVEGLVAERNKIFVSRSTHDNLVLNQ